MTRKAYVLSEDDKRWLDEYVKDKAGREVQGTQNRGLEDQGVPDGDNSYVAMTPKGEWLPGITGDEPGVLECCVFKLDPCADGTTNPQPVKLVPIKDPDDGNHLTPVFNIYKTEHPPFVYFSVHKTKYGGFVSVEAREEEQTTTLDPLNTTTTTFDPNGPSECAGQCKWIWNAASDSWELDEDNCETTTTTTTTAQPCIDQNCSYRCDGVNWRLEVDECPDCDCVTPDPNIYSCTEAEESLLLYTLCSDPPATTECPCPDTTTTTAQPCDQQNCGYRCDGVGWQLKFDGCPDCDCEAPDEIANPCTSEETALYLYTLCSQGPTTTTTSTTTEAPCQCVYPGFCGDSDGDCTSTDCLPGGEGPNNEECPPATTTTTPDPSTTTTTSTTTAAPDCSLGCKWTVVPTSYGWTWTLYEDNCPIQCPCPYPAVPPDICHETETGCVFPPDPPPPPRPCTGKCKYIWDQETAKWYWVSTWSSCSPIGRFCYCRPPGSPGSEDCEIRYGTCVDDHNTTTTIDPSTTTTTSTTTDPCEDGECHWEWDGNQWNNTYGDCTVNCPCSEPHYTPTDLCEIAKTPCHPADPNTTTTTDPNTTTTPNPINGACCFLTPEGVLTCTDTSPEGCTSLNGQFFNNQSCAQVTCESDTTTTSAPTTTPDPTIGACCWGSPPLNVSCYETTKDQCDLNPRSFSWTAGEKCNSESCLAVPTTTTTTTTLQPATGACCYGPANYSCVDVWNEIECATSYNGNFNPNVTCAEQPCTTTTTSTTPTPTCSGDCDLVCTGGTWVPFPDVCAAVADCECPLPITGPVCADEGSTVTGSCTPT